MRTGSDPAPRPLTPPSAVCLLALALAFLAGCGSAAKPAHPTAHTATPAADTHAAASLLARCLHAHGLDASSASGAARVAAHGPAATRARVRAALRSCAAAAEHRHVLSAAAAASLHRALVSFTACVRRHGVALPEPNTSGHGPVFPAKGLAIHTPRFRDALAACRAALRQKPAR